MDNTKTHTDLTTRKLARFALLTALNIVAFFIHFRAPWGTVHLGNIMIFMIAIIFGKEEGMVAGGLSAAMFDFLGGYGDYVLWSLVIKGLTGWVVGYTAHAGNKKGQSLPVNILACILGGIVSLVGYEIAYIFMYGWAAAITKIPSSLISTAVGMVGIPLAMLIGPRLKKAGLMRD
ncbi:MAG TPA: hypothetical protein DC038_06825 [Clostridiales bacterium]|nr:hypothetical protein [Clostridiales bacterium]